MADAVFAGPVVEFVESIGKVGVKFQLLGQGVEGFFFAGDFFGNGFHCVDGFFDAVFVVGVFPVREKSESLFQMTLCRVKWNLQGGFDFRYFLLGSDFCNNPPLQLFCRRSFLV